MITSRIIYPEKLNRLIFFRRKELESYFDEYEQILSISTHPRLGCSDVFYPPIENKVEDNFASRSYSTPDQVLNQTHARFW